MPHGSKNFRRQGPWRQLPHLGGLTVRPGGADCGMYGLLTGADFTSIAVGDELLAKAAAGANPVDPVFSSGNAMPNVPPIGMPNCGFSFILVDDGTQDAVITVDVHGVDHMGVREVETVTITTSNMAGALIQTRSAWRQIDGIYVTAVAGTLEAGNELLLGITGDGGTQFAATHAATTPALGWVGGNQSRRLRQGIPFRVSSAADIASVIAMDPVNEIGVPIDPEGSGSAINVIQQTFTVEDTAVQGRRYLVLPRYEQHVDLDG